MLIPMGLTAHRYWTHKGYALKALWIKGLVVLDMVGSG